MTETGDALPVTALLAPEPGTPVVVFDGNAALRMAVVDRRSVAGLDESWDTSGVYLLLDPVALDGTYGVYVGKAPAGLRLQVRQHARGKEHWSRALLVTRDTTHGWHSAQVGWLEGRLYDLLDGTSLATLANGNRPQDESLPAYDRVALEAAVTPIAAVLRLLGCSPDAFDEDAPSESPGRSPRQYNVTLADLVRALELGVGEKLTSTSLSAPGIGVVAEDGSVTVDGQRFPSLSAAGSHVRDGKATNGWSFWAVERDGTSVPLATVRARYLRRSSGEHEDLASTRGEQSAPPGRGGESTSGPRRHADQLVVAAKRARTGEPHVKPLNELAARIEAEVGMPVPLADPDYGGTNAQLLLLLTDPGTMTDEQTGSGFIGPDNDDPTAERVHLLLASHGIAADDVLAWNAVPWLRPGNAGRPLTAAEQELGNRWLTEFLDLLPHLMVILVLGRPAQVTLSRASAPSLDGVVRIDAPPRAGVHRLIHDVGRHWRRRSPRQHGRCPERMPLARGWIVGRRRSPRTEHGAGA